MNQKDAYEFFTPLIEFSGKIYKKTSPVYAYLAEPGEYIETWTEDGLETTNYAKNGDYIVQNLNTIAKEKLGSSYDVERTHDYVAYLKK